MKFTSIDWTHVTKYSQALAIFLFVGVFALGFWLGITYELHALDNATKSYVTKDPNPNVTDVTYSCDEGKTVRTLYHTNSVQILLSDGRNLTLPHAISASGARYANDDESIVFWNKGNTAFITEGTNTTFANCATMPIPN